MNERPVYEPADDEDDERGCWHYGYDGRYCVMHDPDTYEPSDDEDGGEA